MSQLERLARPFPDKYVRAPAKGKYGDYVPHHIVTQALLAILGPFDLHVGEVFKGDDGKIEGCLVTIATIATVIDGVPVAVTEVGDCEQPTNWKTQGARLKDCISDGVKRCAARLGCGLHLYSGSEFFLYDQLRQENAASADGHDAARGQDALGLTAVPAGKAVDSAAEDASAPASPPLGESARNAGSSSAVPPQDDGPAVSKLRRDNLKARCVALQADGVSVADAREELKLPLVDSCNEEQMTRFEALVSDLEAALEAPFEKADA